MATMRDVAAAAGVSAKTVSRVFNADLHVLPETRAHVEKVMRELNYVPNALATTFRAGHSSAIGVAVPDIVDPFFAEIARAVDEVARRHGFATLLTSLGERPEQERDRLESLLNRRLAGLIVAPVGTDHSWLKRWKDTTPVVFVDRAPVGFTTDTFSDDDEAGARLATRHLVEHGHRRIALVGGAPQLSTEIHRRAGYREALADAGIGWDDEIVLTGVETRERGEQALEALAVLAVPPSAVFSSNARTSMALVHGLRTRDVAVVGFGDFPMADVIEPALTVIDQAPGVVGAQAAERVFERLANPRRRLRRANLLAVALIERQSCCGGKPAGG
jgi:LacI family transcriptional regulator